MKTKKGFTLLELMIVVVILGVLALIAVPALLNAAEQSREAAVGGNVSAAVSTLSSRLAIGSTIVVADLADTLNESSANPFDSTAVAFSSGAVCAVAGLVSIEDSGGTPASYTISGCDASGAAPTKFTKTVYAPETDTTSF